MTAGVSALSALRMHEALDETMNFKPSKNRHDLDGIGPNFDLASEHVLLERDLDGEIKGMNTVPDSVSKFTIPETSSAAGKQTK